MFLETLGKTAHGTANEGDVIVEMQSCAVALGDKVAILNSFYRKHKLDSEAVV